MLWTTELLLEEVISYVIIDEEDEGVSKSVFDFLRSEKAVLLVGFDV